MLRIFGVVANLFLVIIIFVRLPEDSVGLSSLGANNDFFLSPRSGRKVLDWITLTFIIFYLVLALQFNLELSFTESTQL